MAALSPWLVKAWIGSVGEKFGTQRSSAETGSLKKDLKVRERLDVKGILELFQVGFRGQELRCRSGRVRIGAREDDGVAGAAGIRQVRDDAVSNKGVGVVGHFVARLLSGFGVKVANKCDRSLVVEVGDEVHLVIEEVNPWVRLLAADQNDVVAFNCIGRVIAREGEVERSEERRVGKECRSRWSP